MNKALGGGAAAASRPAPSDVQAGTDATRYFAAGAYRDRLFRQQVIEYFQHRWYRAAAPEFGIDERLVHQHCQRADTREFIRNVVMLLLFLLLVILSLPWTLSTYDGVADFPVNLILALIPPTVVMFAEQLYIEHFLIVKQFGRRHFVNRKGPILADMEFTESRRLWRLLALRRIGILDRRLVLLGQPRTDEGGFRPGGQGSTLRYAHPAALRPAKARPAAEPQPAPPRGTVRRWPPAARERQQPDAGGPSTSPDQRRRAR